VKVSNDKLKKEKSEYQVIFGELTGACGVRRGANVCAYAWHAFACCIFLFMGARKNFQGRGRGYLGAGIAPTCV
jgi:hypothetical protein